MTLNRRKLRRQLATSKKRLEPYTLLIEYSLGKTVNEAFEKAGFNVANHLEYFSCNATDVDWLERAGKLQRSNRKLKFISLTKDREIGRKPEERDCVFRAGLRQFVLTRGTFSADEMINIFFAAMNEIAKFVEENEPPFIVTVTQSGLGSIYRPEHS
jgi:hypothetical protein